MLHSTVACNLDLNMLQAALPLFEQERVAALEWSFDALYQHPELPEWFSELIGTYSENNRLIGHGVYFSIFSGKWLDEQQKWLQQLKKLSAVYHFDHLSEHFGFMTGSDFHKGAPLGMPFTDATLRIGIDRLKRIQDAAGCPVGLENLAFSYSAEEAKRHGDFLARLVEPVNGFIILDLHNLYCQLHNFDRTFTDMLALYPLERVREIHLSGGSWIPSTTVPNKIIRRDTHDDAVPELVFDLLKETIPKCPQLQYVVLEQLGSALDTEARRVDFRHDFYTMDSIVKCFEKSSEAVERFLPKRLDLSATPPPEDLALHRQQVILSEILENADDTNQARTLLLNSPLAQSEWQIENWDPAMLETAVAIARKWKNGFE